MRVSLKVELGQIQSGGLFPMICRVYSAAAFFLSKVQSFLEQLASRSRYTIHADRGTVGEVWPYFHIFSHWQ